MEIHQLTALLEGYARQDPLADAADRRRARIPRDRTPRGRARLERRRHRLLPVPGRWLWA